MAGVGELLASAVFKQVCAMLCSAIWTEIASQLNLSADLENLRIMLVNIQTVLRKAEKRSMKDGGVSIWMKELKTAAYDREDMLMDFEYQISRRNCGSPPNTKKVSIPLKLRKTLPGELKAMKKSLENIARLREIDFTADTRSGEQDVIQTPTTSPTIGEDIVGRIEDKREMMELLKEDCKHSFIPIYGFGGLGKTTLAQMVFSDDKTEEDFDIRAWVHVSTKFDVEKIGRSIISQVDGQSKEFDFASVQQRVKMILSGKRSLIVLDDIWEENANNLELVRTMLKVDKPGSKIIVTTRSKQVAERMNADLPFKLAVLPDKECWDLFKAKAFPTGTAELQMEKEMAEKEMLGAQIVRKCNGVPLAVKSLGYRLRNEPLPKWEETLRSELWEEERDPISATTSTAVLPSLKISYYYMPDYLRPCFAYFSIFPKGFLTEKSDLIQRWIALGFVATQRRAEEYLRELIGMSFLHAAIASTSISARYSKPHNELFHMHDLVHELARSVAGEEVAFFDASRGGSSYPKMDNCRYMLFSNLNGSAPECNDMPSKARAIHFKDCTGCKPSPDIFSKSKLLRVLDFVGMQTVELPKSMGSLRHVQVLNLSENTCLTRLHRSICNFQKLHYLDLHGCLNLRGLPKELHKLKGLIHLNLSECTSLKVLPRLFGELQNLSFLNLSSCSKLEELPGSFSHLTNLEHLNLSFCCQLKLSSVSFECMKSLLYLNLSGCSSLEALPEFCGENVGCLKLEILDLSNCAELAILPESCARLHKLRCLNLSGCSRIQNILHFLSKFVNLEYLNLTGVLMEKNLSRVGTRNNSEVPGTSTGDGSDDHSEELQLKMLHGILKNMSRLEYLSVGGLTLFSEQGIDRDLLTLPDFMVSTRGTGDCSNIGLLQSILDSTHCELNIRCLEIVKSPEEAKKVELGKRRQLGSLSLEWSPSERRTPSEPTVNTMAVLENLKPHPDLQRLSINGYNHTAFPLWIRGINDTIPNLLKLVLSDLVLCDHLPPLGYLPNLEELEIFNMPQLMEVRLAPCKNLKRLSLELLAYGVSLIFHEDHRGKARRTDVQEMELGHAEERQPQTISEVQSSDSSEGQGNGKESVLDKAVLRLKSWVNYSSKTVEKAAPIPVPEVPQQFPSLFEAKAALPMLRYLKIQYCGNVTFYPDLSECEYFIDESIVSVAHVYNRLTRQHAKDITEVEELVRLTRQHAKDFIEVEELVINGCGKFNTDFNASILLPRKLKITDCGRFDPTMWLNIRLQELEIDCLKTIDNFDLLLRTAPNLEKLTLSSCHDDALVEYISCTPHTSYIKINKMICFRVKPFHQHQSRYSSNFLLLRQNHDFAINKLFIRNLDNVKSPEEVGHGELAGYGQLHSLSLEWSRQDSSRVDDTAVLQGLEPPRNLENLSIEGYQGTIFCSWMTNISSLLPYLVTIELAYMANCERLPSLGQLAHLEVLRISFMPSIRKVDSSYYGGRNPFRKLRELRLCEMENLDEWSTSLDDEQQQGDEIFPNLESLVIKNCPRLWFNPYFPGSITLRIMEIINCGISSNSLKFVQDIVNLVRLNISNCSNLTALPETIRGCRFLKELEILECWNFSELPEWLGELTSLTSLTIHAAKLESLPQSIRCLTALEILDLKMCNYKIRERCLSGEDKDKIKHVQHVYIREAGHSISILSDGISLLQKISSIQLTELSIEDLQALRPDEAEKLKLVEMEQLLSLSLGWNCSAHERREKDKAVLEKLQCHHTLERFCMMNYAGCDFPPRWMSSLPNLTKIELSGLLSGYLDLDHLRNLEELHVSSFYLSKRGEQVNDFDIKETFSKSSIRIWSAKPLKKLRRIVISIVGELEWETPTSLSEDIFPSLEDLEINCCQRIRFKPSIPRSARYIISGGKQQLCVCSFPSFERVMGSATSASSSKMEIKYIGDPSSYSWESLEQLNIAELTVDNCTNESPLPGCIRDWKSLRKLEILNCENIKTLPDWLADITSLVELKLETYRMNVLPPSVIQLTALRTLILSQCTRKFEQRYCESGEDRIKIKHIEDIQIYVKTFIWFVHCRK